MTLIIDRLVVMNIKIIFLLSLFGYCTDTFATNCDTASYLSATPKINNSLLSREINISCENNELLIHSKIANNLMFKLSFLPKNGIPKLRKYDNYINNNSLKNTIFHSKDSAQVWINIHNAIEILPKKLNTDIYKVEGNLFLGNKLRKDYNKIIPSHLFLAILVPNYNVGAVYIFLNDNSGYYDFVSIQDFKKNTLIDLYPSFKQKSYFNYRYLLPTSENDVKKFDRFVISQTSTSPIFLKLPSRFPIQNQEIKQKTLAQQNRSEAVSIASNHIQYEAKTVKDVFLDFINK